MDIQLTLKAVNIQQYLGGFPNTGNCFKGMAVAQDRKVGDGIQIKKEGTSNDKKITDHQIGRPGQKQIGQAIKHIKNITAFLPDDIMNLSGKRFKPGISVKLVQHNFI